ncbi:MAG: GGDEF domain-containing protein [Campylobacterota bacterium]|nr:GGDEF domain-containing protein [Campylobacterota bacterium]
MKETMIELIKSACKNEEKLESLTNIYRLYDQLQYSENLNEMADTLFEWLKSKYNVTNMSFSLFDMNDNTTTVILKKGSEFFLDGELTFYFIVNTHTDINGVFSFAAVSKEHYESINKDNELLEATFFQITPIIQNGIMKKHHIEASSIDSVTNVHNRKYMINHIHNLVKLSKYKSESITFLMVGVDHFKAVIDEFDYDIGDLVLIELAKVIHSNIKEFDVVARLTGDEFLVALVNQTNTTKAQDVAQKIIDEFANTRVIVNDDTGQILQKTICVGIASYPQDDSDIDTVLKYADNFLYEAKNKGRSSYAVYTDEDEGFIDLF